jgi:hypothetical protein
MNIEEITDFLISTHQPFVLILTRDSLLGDIYSNISPDQVKIVLEAALEVTDDPIVED